MNRISKDEYYLQIAEVVALRSTCLEKQVGCVLVNKRGIILATGYNGAPYGHPHCSDKNVCRKLLYSNDSACPSAHAELNAILHVRSCMEIYTCYTTLSPCIACCRSLLNTGCQRIVFRHAHKHIEPRDLWFACRSSKTWIHKELTWNSNPYSNL